ncbi:hypothetical protein WG909_14435 [Peptostreptococcaceae bacterium AGR-M142]
MIENKYPIFERGRILKIEMLEHLRDFPLDIFNIFLKDYSNGILKGFDIKIEDNNIILSSGIIAYNQKIYYSKDRTVIKYKENETDANLNRIIILKLKFLQQKDIKDFRIRDTKIYMDDKEIKSDEIEICRFKLKNKARLRMDHEDFEDLDTEYNTVNLINTTYSNIEHKTIHPYIIKFFYKEMLKFEISNQLDLNFCLNASNSNLLNREYIINYLKIRLNLADDMNFNNQDIYNLLLQILNTTKGLGKKNQNPNYFNKKILID